MSSSLSSFFTAGTKQGSQPICGTAGGASPGGDTGHFALCLARTQALPLKLSTRNDPVPRTQAPHFTVFASIFHWQRLDLQNLERESVYAVFSAGDLRCQGNVGSMDELFWVSQLKGKNAGIY